MPELSIEFDVTCGTCGASLNSVIDIAYNGNRTLEVEPCEDCLQDKYDKGVEDTKEEG